MMALKQEYGEVVVAVGSALNPQNTSAFTQADCALALSPLLPQACVRLPAVDYPSVPLPLVVQPGASNTCSGRLIVLLPSPHQPVLYTTSI